MTTDVVLLSPQREGAVRPAPRPGGGARGFIEDGLLSHGFLKRYGSWTIDFDSMTYLFER